MKTRPKYKYFCDGREVGADEALDRRGIIKDGFSMRVPMIMRDGVRNRKTVQYDPARRLMSTFESREEDEDEHEQERTESDAATVSDGTSNPLGLHKPGFRFTTDAAVRRTTDTSLQAVYAAVDARDASAWRGPDYDAAARYIPDARDSAHDPRERAYRDRALADANAWRGSADALRPAPRSTADAYAQYDAADAAAYLRGK